MISGLLYVLSPLKNFLLTIQTLPQFTLENVTHLILPKIHGTKDLDYASRCLYEVYMTTDRENSVNIIPSIESARAMINLESIAGWGSSLGRQMGGQLGALLVCSFTDAYSRYTR